MISIMSVCNCTFMLFLETKGRLGMSVKRNSKDGGMAMMKLYEMAEARSAKPFSFTWLRKNCSTLYNEMPLKKISMNGINTISTELQMMGEKTAQVKLEHSVQHKVIPFSLTLRASL